MHILLIAFNAPPKNSPEAIQVARYLSKLDKELEISLVTTPYEKGWVSKDISLHLELNNTRTIIVDFPFYSASQRILARKWFRWFHVPDEKFWLNWKFRDVLRKLDSKPDLIYSRSYPLSTAMLANNLKSKLGIPWIMHLSDPWADSPYRELKGQYKLRDQNYEKMCFNGADAISVTTVGLAEFYRSKYRDRAKDIFVSPNVMPNEPPSATTSEIDETLKLVYTGALYGTRKPTDILAAMRIVAQNNPNLLEYITLDFYGNMTPDITQQIVDSQLPRISIHGKVSFAEAQEKQAKADLVVAIEPDGSHPLLTTFLPSKIVDYIAARKPILAITPEGSETWQLCNNQGYGWAFRPGDTEGIAKLLLKLVERCMNKTTLLPSELPLPRQYSAKVVVSELIQRMNSLVEKKL